MTEQTHSRKPLLSIIIPTRNRAEMLRDTLASLPVACVGQEQGVECLVVDNGSTDATRSVTECFAATAPFPVRYVHESCPGLHVGRNLGALFAESEILAYLDDDVYVQPGWAEALIARFQSDERIALVGGPCLPVWEALVPDWVEAFKREHAGGWYYGGFSLIDLGAVPRSVPYDCVFGCNYSVRKSVLLKAGGFHPDGMPLSLLRFRGDGEDAVSKFIEDSELTVYYEPRAAVGHRMPPKRLTKEYILGVCVRSAISCAYTEYRATHRCGIFALVRKAVAKIYFLARSFGSCPRVSSVAETPDDGLYELCALTIRRTIAKHFLRILFSPALARWVTQPSYFITDSCPYWRKE